MKSLTYFVFSMLFLCMAVIFLTTDFTVAQLSAAVLKSVVITAITLALAIVIAHFIMRKRGA